MEYLSIEQIEEVAASQNYTRGALNEESCVISFTREGVKINVYYTTGTVGTCIDHPTQGKTQLFRKRIALVDNVDGLTQLFSNPRQHTDVGYQRVAYDPSANEIIDEEKIEISAQITRIDEHISALQSQRKELTLLVRRRGGGRRGRRRPTVGRIIRVAEDDEPSTIALFVKNLGFSVGEEELEQLFTEHGVQPVRVHLARRERGGRSKGFGFAVFANETEQQNALAAVAGASVDDREVVVEVAKKGGELSPEERALREREPVPERQEPAQRKEKEPRYTDNSVFVGNLPEEFTEDELRTIFGDLDIVRSRYVRRGSYGFVEFESAEDQQKAADRNGLEISGNEITVELSK